MNLSEGRDEVRARGFDGLTDGRANTFLNAAQAALDDFAPWPWLEASATGTAPLTISDLKAIRYVWNTTNDVSLRGSDLRWLRDNYGPDLTVTGTALWWYLDGLTTLRVAPADTSSTFSVDYIKTSPDLAADGDTPLFPDRLAQVWIDLAVVEAYMDADEYSAAQAAQVKAETRLARVVDVYLGRNLQNGQEMTVFNSVDG